MSNELFHMAEDGQVNEVIMDAIFCVDGTLFHLECQSVRDVTMTRRMATYDLEAALRGGTEAGSDFRLPVPRSGVIYLRSTKNTPEQPKVRMDIHGPECTYEVVSLRVKDYTIDDIFGRKLWFLIPFYIFSFESKLGRINGSEELLRDISDTYGMIRTELETLLSEGMITDYEAHLIYNTTEYVARHLAANYSNVAERIGGAMGGRQIPEFPAMKIAFKELAEEE